MKVKAGGALGPIAYAIMLILAIALLYGVGGMLESVLGLKGVH